MSERIILWGRHGVKNFGDDALMLIGVNILKGRYRTEDIFITGENEKYIEKMCPGIRLISREEVSNCMPAKIIFNGGQQYFSYFRESIIKKVLRRVKKLFTFSDVIEKIQKLKKTEDVFQSACMYAIGLGIGPFEGNSYMQKFARKIVLNMKLVYVRDEDSFNLCKKWKVKARLGADLCYLEKYLPIDITKIKLQRSDCKSIGVIIRDWPHTKRGSSYFNSLLDVVHELRINGFRAEFISLAPDYDKLGIEKLRNAGEEVISWDPVKYTLQNFAEMLSKYSFFVSARYHGTLIGALMGIPSICIQVSEKVSSGAKQTGLADYLWKYPFESKDLIAKVKEMTCDYEEILKKMNYAVENQKKLAELMAKYFLETIDKG